MEKRPLRTAAIRRCGFKLPNDKYQCQMAGGKFQPVVELWYCRLHDCHAQDRCQVLVHWAGMGAQCEHFGALNESTGKKLCERHAMQNRSDARPHNGQRNESTEESTNHEGEKQGVAISNDPSSSQSTVSSTEDAMTDAPHFAQTTTESSPLLPSTEGSTDSKSSKLVPSEGKHFSDAREDLNLKIPDQSELKAASVSPPDVLRDSKKASHTRIDSLAPFFDSSLRTEGGKCSTPTTPTYDGRRGLQSTLGNLVAAYGATSYSPAVHAHINFLNAMRDGGPSELNRIAAVYAQCCVCLEPHGEYNMRQIEPCKHQYRELCLRKAISIDGVRKFNCSSCTGWMQERNREILERGRL
ncbi:uncharacterized protein M421DRAFT_128763 [Didymella exigua CBS 183.55]|uniref:RING-type domain-containing protein n=1 Tax=Didymella exigua CBS 183.55 TaxID=1150837 RepID=A0A6A5RWV8_9PLEO|nr:uncharacterized protein M421DRAFT_128763 [Didymella exigua CBS 183.55]KAF1929747.1 hypothetical protein M421DRAFT_128763 [Didymella exigua CBS 183.55]